MTNAQTTPAVSVIMAAYNAEVHLRTAVESILSQTLTNLELIVVNDGSTADILSQCAERDSRVRVASQANAGLAATRNAAIAQSRADFVAIMDSDDIAHPSRLEMPRDFLLENPDCAAVSCRCDFIDERGALIKIQSPQKPFRLPGMPLEELLPEQAWVNQTAMLRVESLGRDEIYRSWFRVLEDFDFTNHRRVNRVRRRTERFIDVAASIGWRDVVRPSRRTMATERAARRWQPFHLRSYYVCAFSNFPTLAAKYQFQLPTKQEIAWVKNLFATMYRVPFYHRHPNKHNFLVTDKDIMLIDLDSITDYSSRKIKFRFPYRYRKMLRRFLHEWRDQPQQLKCFTEALADDDAWQPMKKS